MAHIYLGIDIGTTSVKCAAVDEVGGILALARHPYPMAHPRQGWAEQDPEDYWRGLVDVVTRCVRECGQQGHTAGDIASLAMSTQGDTLIVTDEHGTPLTPAISWMDARAQAEYDEFLSQADASFWYRETGSPINPLSSACSIRWLVHHRPELKGANARFCYVADFLAKRLCDVFATDVPSASWTPLFSPSARTWSQPVLDLLGISSETLPTSVESGEVIGELSPAALAELGLSDGTMLIAGAFDQAAAAHGSGATASGRSVLSCGTAWVLYSVSSQPPRDPNERLCTCCHTRPAEWGLVLPFTGGSVYDWLNRTVADPPDRPASKTDPLIFIPHLYGGLSPDWRGESKGSILGLTLAHTAEDIRLALMRGLASEARRNLEAAEPLCGRIASIRMVGGAGKSATWPQLIADILNRSVQVSDCVESACLGAAMLAAGDISASWPDTQPTRTFEPDTNAAEQENHLYERYLNAYNRLLLLYS